jgi:outer membrane autotransporter protein
VRSATKGENKVTGIAGGYDWNFGDWILGALAHLDNINTSIDGYTERGGTGLELIYPEQSIKSATTALGLRLARTFSFDSGDFIPELRVSAVRENKNDARQISTQLAVNRATRLTINTDAPDRSYHLIGLGGSAALGEHVNVFVDYERRRGDFLISNWTASAGIIIEF